MQELAVLTAKTIERPSAEFLAGPCMRLAARSGRTTSCSGGKRSIQGLINPEFPSRRRLFAQISER